MKSSWRTIALSAAAALVLAFAVMPRSRPTFRPWGELTGLSEQWRSAEADYYLLQTITSRAEAREVARALPAVRPGDAIFRFEAPLPAAAAARIEKSLREELAVIAPNGTAYPIAVVARVDSAALGGLYRRTVVLPDSPDEPCVVVFGVSPQNLRYPGVLATDRLLGTCGFYAAFGAPGRGMAEWMRGTNLALAAFYQRPSALGDGVERIEVRHLADATTRALAACAASRPGACAAALESPRVPWEEVWPWRRPTKALYERTPSAVPGVVTFTREYSGSTESAWLRAGLLSDLAGELGAERFAALWRDERVPTETFEAREGRAFDDWVRDRVVARVEPYAPGPGVAGVPLALALALAGAAAFAGIRYAKREMS